MNRTFDVIESDNARSNSDIAKDLRLLSAALEVAYRDGEETKELLRGRQIRVINLTALGVARLLERDSNGQKSSK